MRNPIGKSNLRKPLKMILLIFIVFIISNTSISRLSQFVIVNREIDRIGSYYKSIGTVQPISEEQVYVNGAQALLSEDPMIDYEDHRRACQGIIGGLTNTDINQYEGTNPEFYDYTSMITKHFWEMSYLLLQWIRCIKHQVQKIFMMD